MSHFHGIFTPLVTPIDPNESPDLDSVRRLVRFQIDSGVHGLWALGTSGEFASFDEDERAGVLAAVLEEANGRVPVIANVSDASTRMTIRHARRAVSGGAAAIAATPPYYYPHSQDELLAHYRQIRDAVDAPLYIYNIPQTVKVKVELATAKALAQEGTASGVKDSQNDFEWLRQLAVFAHRQNLSFTLFGGTRHLIDTAVQIGADGAIPSLANAFPEICVQAYEAARRGNWDTAAEAQGKIIDLEGIAAGIAGGSRNAGVLGTLKAILHSRGTISHPALTAPLRTLTEEEQVDAAARAREILDSLPVH